MNIVVRRKLDMAARVREFVRAHAASEPGYAPVLTLTVAQGSDPGRPAVKDPAYRRTFGFFDTGATGGRSGRLGSTGTLPPAMPPGAI